MIDRIDKALSKLSDDERVKLRRLFMRIQSHEFTHLDIRKLKGRDDIFRVRAGKLRIIFRISENQEIYIIALERRSDTTYNF